MHARALLLLLPVASAFLHPKIESLLDASRAKIDRILHGKAALMDGADTPAGYIAYPLTASQFPPAPPHDKAVSVLDVMNTFKTIDDLINTRDSIRRACDDINSIIDTIHEEMEKLEKEGWNGRARRDDVNLLQLYMGLWLSLAEAMREWTNRPFEHMVNEDVFELLYQWYDAMDKDAMDQVCEHAKRSFEVYEEQVEKGMQKGGKDAREYKMTEDSLVRASRDMVYCREEDSGIF